MTESTGLVETTCDLVEILLRCAAGEELGGRKYLPAKLREAASRLTALEAEVALLREALEPFAFEYDHRREHMGHEPDDWPAFRTAHQITMGHLRRARAALGGKP